MLSCPTRCPTAAEKRQREVQKALNKLGGSAAVQRLLAEHRMILEGSDLKLLAAFKNQDWSDLLRDIGLLCGRNNKANGQLALAPKQLWALPKGRPDFTDNQSSIFKRVVCTTNAVATAVESGLDSFKASATVSYGPLSMSAEYATESSFEKSSTTKTDSYTEVLQKVLTKAIFTTGKLELSTEFKADLAAITDGKDLKPLQQTMMLTQLFAAYGHLHPASISAGGKQCAKTTILASQVDMSSSETKSQSVTVSAEATFTASASASVSNSSSNTKGSSSSNSKKDENYSVTYFGGDLSKTGDEAAWLESLNEANDWAPIELTDVGHLIDILPADLKKKIGTILEDKTVQEVFGGIDALLESKALADLFSGSTVSIANGDLVLGVAAQQTPAKSLQNILPSQMCYWRARTNQNRALQWKIVAESEGSTSVMLQPNGLGQAAFLTMNADGQVFCCTRRTTSPECQQWVLKKGNAGLVLVNCSTFKVLGTGTKEQTLIPGKANAWSNDWKFFAIPNENSYAPSWMCNNNRCGGNIFSGGDWLRFNLDESEDYNKIKEATTNMISLVDEWVDAIRDPLQWWAFVNCLKTNNMAAAWHVSDVDGDNNEYEKTYQFSLSNFKGNMWSRSEVKAAIKQGIEWNMQTFLDFVKNTEGDIEIMWIGVKVSFPRPWDMSPPSGPYKVAEGVPSATNNVDIKLTKLASSDFSATWPEVAK